MNKYIFLFSPYCYWNSITDFNTSDKRGKIPLNLFAVLYFDLNDNLVVDQTLLININEVIGTNLYNEYCLFY